MFAVGFFIDTLYQIEILYWACWQFLSWIGVRFCQMLFFISWYYHDFSSLVFLSFLFKEISSLPQILTPTICHLFLIFLKSIVYFSLLIFVSCIKASHCSIISRNIAPFSHSLRILLFIFTSLSLLYIGQNIREETVFFSWWIAIVPVGLNFW